MKTLLFNSKVWLNKNNFVESIGFDSDSGKIIFIGSDYETDKIKNDFDEVINLDKKLVLPSFTDGHCHFIKASEINSELNLRNTKTKSDFINGIKSYKSNNISDWIVGGYFSDSSFKEKVSLDKNFLDEICSDIPVLVSRFDMHSAIANSKALEISNIENKKNDFTSEEIICDEYGNLKGELKERARDYVLSCIPKLTLEERVKNASEEINKLHSFGITAISDITLPEDLEIYKELIKKNKLLLRVDSRLPFKSFYKINFYKEEFENISSNIKFNSLKAFYDGSLSSKTALFHSNYKNTNHNGMKTEIVTSGEFEKLALEIDKTGLQISVHAIGDKAVTELLDFNERLEKINGRRDRRFRIEHAQHIQEKDLQRFKELNVIASVQPSHLFSDAKTATEILDNFTTTHNYKKLIDIGAAVCFGTDFPIVSENPFETIYFAMTRKTDRFENGFLPEYRIEIVDCLNAYTINNAYTSFDERQRGNLKVGKFADLIILEDLFKMKADEIKNAKVIMTYFNGTKVY